MGRRRRIGLTLADNQLEDIERFAGEAGMSLSQYTSLCVSIGLRTMKRVTEPEKIYTPEEQVRMMAAMGFDRSVLQELLVSKDPSLLEEKLKV